MKIKKISPKFIFLLPVLAGLITGQWFNNNSNNSEEKTGPVSPLSPSSQTEAPKQTPHSISHYLLTSQALFSKAIELSQKGINSDKERTQPANNQRIVQLVNEAVNQATQAILYYPDDPRGWAQRAKIYQAIEKYVDQGQQMALRDLKQAVRLQPGNVNYLKEISRLCLKLGLTQEAVSYLQQAAQANPTEAQLWFDLAQLQTKIGQLAAARNNYQRLLPLLADKKQRETVKNEMKAIERLLAQAPQKEEPTITASPQKEKEIVLPENPLPLEAEALSQNLIIAAPEEEKEKGIKNEELVSNSLSGNALLPQGKTEVVVKTNQLDSEDQVYLAPLGDDQNQVLRLKNKGEKEFTVAIKQPLEKDLEFKWWIIKS